MRPSAKTRKNEDDMRVDVMMGERETETVGDVGAEDFLKDEENIVTGEEREEEIRQSRHDEMGVG